MPDPDLRISGGGGGGGAGDKKIIMVFSKVANPRFSLEIRLVHSLVCVS